MFPPQRPNWEFEYLEDRLLPLMGTTDMWDSNGEPCVLVAKSGNATGTTIDRTNGVFPMVRDYFNDMSVKQTSWIGG